MGNVITEVDMSNFNKHVENYAKSLEEDAHQQERLTESSSFQLVYAAKKYDDWFLDPIVGFLIPGFGDLLSSLVTLPAVYVSVIKLRSLSLTFAIFYAMFLDFIVGVVPVAGDLIDAFHKSNKKACRWIVGYVEQDPDTIEEINRNAKYFVFLLIGVAIVGYLFYSLLVAIIEWIQSLF